MFPSKITTIVFRYRVFLSFVVLSFILYLIVHSWLFLPPPTYFLEWNTKTIDLEVNSKRLGLDYRNQFQSGDVILEIDDVPVIYGERIFPSPVKRSYHFVIERDDQILSQEINIPSFWQRNLIDYEIPRVLATIVGLILWSIGFFTVIFALRRQPSALIIGFGFQLLALYLLTPGSAKFGLPVARLFSRILFYLLPSFTIFLAFAPFPHSIESKVVRFISTLFGIGVTFSLLAVLALFFGPADTSMWVVIGIDPVVLQAAVLGLSVIGSVLILLWRAIRSPRRSYHRQQLTILFTLLNLAVIPTLLFIIVPAQGNTAIPYSLAYSMFLLAPTGYFFVLHRSGHLKLDLIVGRIITTALLILSVFLTYTTFALFKDSIVLNDQQNAPGPEPLYLVILIVTFGHKKIAAFVDSLIYGQEEIGVDVLRQAAAQLSKNPDPQTVSELIEFVGDKFMIEKIAVLSSVPMGFKTIAATKNLCYFTIPETTLTRQTQLRKSNPEVFKMLPDWVSIALPIEVGDQVLGHLLLAEPKNAHLHTRQLQRLQEMADVLAYGLQVMNLVHATQTLSSQMIFEKELQRQRIATEIHNEPLQTLVYVITMLNNGASGREILELVNMLRRVTKDLRRIMVDLRPNALSKSLETMIRHVVSNFSEQQHQLDVTCNIAITYEGILPEQSRLAAFYILEEALNNIAKHADASAVNITATVQDHTLHLSIVDDGCGLKIKIASSNLLVKENHFGISVMRRWAQIGCGEIVIENQAAGGTSVRASLPLQSSESFRSLDVTGA